MTGHTRRLRGIEQVKASAPEAVGEPGLLNLAWSPGNVYHRWLPEGAFSTLPLPSLAGIMENTTHTNTQL